MFLNSKIYNNLNGGADNKIEDNYITPQKIDDSSLPSINFNTNDDKKKFNDFFKKMLDILEIENFDFIKKRNIIRIRKNKYKIYN
jgi:hypothetical protein